MPLLLTALVALAPAADPEPPALKFAAEFRKPQDKFTASVEKSVPVWTITSRSGIGHATVSLKSGSVPQKVIIRFAGMHNLSFLQVDNGKLSVQGGVSRRGEKNLIHFDDQGKKIGRAGAAACTMHVVPLKDGIEVELTIAKPGKQWKLDWIDDYRR